MRPKLNGMRLTKARGRVDECKAAAGASRQKHHKVCFFVFFQRLNVFTYTVKHGGRQPPSPFGLISPPWVAVDAAARVIHAFRKRGSWKHHSWVGCNKGENQTKRENEKIKHSRAPMRWTDRWTGRAGQAGRIGRQSRMWRGTDLQNAQCIFMCFTLGDEYA